jgi:four helix bundle protein
MKTFRTLDMAIDFYGQVENLKITGHLRDQLIRAAASIPLNLSEGNAKPSIKEKRRFYQTAYASLKESQTIFKMAKIDESNSIHATANHLGACLYKLIQSKIKELGSTQSVF